jgi:hypothetical protein
MPGIGTPIVIGGGIQLASPNALNEGLFLSSITPPAATTSPRWRIITSTNPDQLAAETEALRADTVIGIGSSNTGIAAGQVRPDVIIGRNISVAHANTGANNGGIFIGCDGMTSAAGSGTGNVVICPTLTQSGGTIMNAENVIIGRGITIQNLQGSSVLIGGTISVFANTGLVVIGQGAAGSANTVTVVGQGASASQANNVSIGQGVSTTAIACIAMGQGHGCPNRDMIKIGHGGQNAGTNGQILIGNGIDPNSVGPDEICLGHSGLGGGRFTVGLRLGQNQHTSGVVVPAYTVQWKSALGTNIAAGDVTFIAPKATGNAVAGAFVFQTSPTGASGATLQTAATRLTISTQGVSTFGTPSTSNPNIIIEGFGGAAVPSLRFNNLTSGAAAAVGTLNNAPSAGDPSFWIPVSIAGNVRYIPAWT